MRFLLVVVIIVVGISRRSRMREERSIITTRSSK